MKKVCNALFALFLLGTFMVSCGQPEAANQASTESPAKVNEKPQKKNNEGNEEAALEHTTC